MSPDNLKLRAMVRTLIVKLIIAIVIMIIGYTAFGLSIYEMINGNALKASTWLGFGYILHVMNKDAFDPRNLDKAKALRAKILNATLDDNA